MTKEEKIKEAWGKYLPKIDENGWLYFGYACNGWDDVEDWLNNFGAICDRSYYDMTYAECDNGDLVNVKIRPKSLQGIENNNGWKILDKESELKEGKYFVICNGREDIMRYFKGYFYDYDQKYKPLSEVTHYDEYIERKPPIY